MSREQSKAKSPLSREAIYRIMVSLSYIVSAFFLIKDLAGGEMMGAVLIVACMAAFSLVLLAMKVLKFSKIVQILVKNRSLGQKIFSRF